MYWRSRVIHNRRGDYTPYRTYAPLWPVPSLTSTGYGQQPAAAIPVRRLIHTERPSRLEPQTFLTGTCAPTTRSPTAYRLSYRTGKLLLCRQPGRPATVFYLIPLATTIPCWKIPHTTWHDSELACLSSLQWYREQRSQSCRPTEPQWNAIEIMWI